MTLFPLYDEIIKKLDGTETVLSNSHCTTITRLKQENLNIIYLIILHHYVLNNGDKSKLPYNCKTISNGKGIYVKKANMLPDDLQKTIYRYLKIISI